MPERDHTRDGSARAARTIHQTDVAAPMKWMLTISSLCRPSSPPS
eukprot:CAMPEP_0119534038 /NCGR_PEP_ID=MMETSP1344-20130328/47337_1 /TAXON_ID=236787 /ORGANISM="Florenciella parvula, Strain CCMP2471" /LENGTH=44 /DNA_ID= /DNA_START= /DNA_END= /DNA_ORIENTATION=